MHDAAKHLHSPKCEVSNQPFPQQDLPRMLAWLLVNFLILSWELSISPAFLGFQISLLTVLTNSEDADSNVKCCRPVTPAVVDSNMFGPWFTVLRWCAALRTCMICWTSITADATSLSSTCPSRTQLTVRRCIIRLVVPYDRTILAYSSEVMILWQDRNVPIVIIGKVIDRKTFLSRKLIKLYRLITIIILMPNKQLKNHTYQTEMQAYNSQTLKTFTQKLHQL